MNWVALERVSGGSALPTIWRRALGLGYSADEEAEFRAFVELFFKGRPDSPAGSVPCPWDCGCMHRVERGPNGSLLGICQCPGGACETYTVSAEERIALELDWPKISRGLGRVFGFEAKMLKVGLHNTFQIGTRGGGEEGVPVILTLAASRAELMHVIGLMTARMGRPFILFVPTERSFSPAAKELLESAGSAMFSVEGAVGIEGGKLVGKVEPKKLFEAVFASADLAVPDEEMARRVFVTLQQDEGEMSRRSRRKGPSLYAVFDLYCLRELTIPQVAAKCRCSIGTVANRLKLLELRLGERAEELRRVAPHFVQYRD